MMGLTPTDIHNKEFERSFRGYAVEDVNEFLDQVGKDYEQVVRENGELKDQLVQLQEKLKSYQKLEETMHNAILVAQETAEDVKQNANREAELIRREAEREGQRIVEDARYRSSKVLAEHEELFKQAQVFKMRFRSFIEAQLSALEMEDWMEPQQHSGQR
jgi:cell division initiation protein